MWITGDSLCFACVFFFSLESVFLFFISVFFWISYLQFWGSSVTGTIHVPIIHRTELLSPICTQLRNDCNNSGTLINKYVPVMIAANAIKIYPICSWYMFALECECWICYLYVWLSHTHWCKKKVGFSRNLFFFFFNCPGFGLLFFDYQHWNIKSHLNPHCFNHELIEPKWTHSH